MKKLKLYSIISFIISIAALVMGAAFHGYRIHPENVKNYNLGVAMGISMLSMFVIFQILGIIFFVIYKKKKQ